MVHLAGSSILLLGATGGLGRHLARHLAEAGAKLTLTARSQQSLDGLEVAGITIAGDLRDPELPRTLVATAVMAYGRLDGVVNASGVVAFGPIAETGDEVLDELWQVNALAPMRVIRAAVPALEQSKAEGGEPFVVHLSGNVSESPTSGLGAYSAVKAALAVYQQVASRELRRQGIRVLDARPGHIETELSRHPISGEAPKLPAGYEPEGVARRIVAAIVADEDDLPSSAFTDVPAAESQMVPVEPADIDTGAHPAVRMAAEMPLEASTPVGSSSEATASVPTDESAEESADEPADEPTDETTTPDLVEPGSAASPDSAGSAPSASRATELVAAELPESEPVESVDSQTAHRETA